MPMRQFKKNKRVLTREEQMTMREQAQAAAQRNRETFLEKERLVAEDKMRKEIITSADGKTIRFRYTPIPHRDSYYT
jgi:hypothetical protein